MNITAPDNILQARLLGRAEGRSDDDLETIKKRFQVRLAWLAVLVHAARQAAVVPLKRDSRHGMQTFHSQTRPVVQSFAAQGLVREVHGNAEINEVYNDFRNEFGQLLGSLLDHS